MEVIWTKIKDFFRALDMVTVFLCLACSAISMSCLYSLYQQGAITSRSRIVIQLVSVGLGLAAALILSKVDYAFMAKLWKIHAPIALLLVIATFFIGVAPNANAQNDHAWLDLGITTIQPSEILKISFILTFAYHLSIVGENINRLKPFLLLCLHGAVPIALIILQKDQGTAAIFLIIFVVMMFAAGLSLRWVAAGVGALCLAAPLIWFIIFGEVQRNRILIAFHPEQDPKDWGYQQYYGRIALGSGGLLGKGLASENFYNYSGSEVYNDYIFSYIGQALGFVGCVITLLLIMLLCVKILMVARMSKDLLGTLICVGVFAMLLFQSAINVAMVLCAFPVVGITLPLFSLGGTSTLITYMSIGLVFSVYRKNKKDLMFD